MSKKPPRSTRISQLAQKVLNPQTTASPGIAAVSGAAASGTGGVGITPTPAEPPPAPKKQLVNHLLVLLDDSGSMRYCYSTAVRQLNRAIVEFRTKSKQLGQKTYVTFGLFSGSLRIVQARVDIDKFMPINESFYGGSTTAFRNANNDLIEQAKRYKLNPDEDTSFVLVCATDGGDNASSRVGSYDLTRLVKEVQATDRWTLAYMAPRGGKYEIVRCGVPEDNVIEWDNTARGAEVAFQATAVALGNYAATRAAGRTSTQKFYTDLSKLTKQEVTSKLVKSNGSFKFVQVEKEEDIKAFAETKTGKPYVIGSLYYALTKPETVQATKEVLIVEKGTKDVYAGPAARQMVGLPVGEPAKVYPGNHANWDVYVKSTSVNRKLVRGTKVIIDLNKTTPDAETWDSAAAIAAAEAKKAAAAAQGTVS